ncbi:MAG: helix-turn-helix domain-containing protein [Actinomycetota bacterium]|nr:helix-turn-helix domain-containing protein [Actinomycetota bacterium]
MEAIPFSGNERRPGARSDARRNRQLIVEAATRVFARGSEPVKMESIAREAGVGVGTLYRNFPTREALVEEVYRSELDRLAGLAEPLLAEHAPAAAMREWMRRYRDFVATKYGMAEALRSAIASGAISSSQTRAQLERAVATLLEAGRADGSLRADVLPADVIAGMAGIMLAAADIDQAGRMQQLLVDALLTHRADQEPTRPA